MEAMLRWRLRSSIAQRHLTARRRLLLGASAALVVSPAIARLPIPSFESYVAGSRLVFVGTVTGWIYRGSALSADEAESRSDFDADDAGHTRVLDMLASPQRVLRNKLRHPLPAPIRLLADVALAQIQATVGESRIFLVQSYGLAARSRPSEVVFLQALPPQPMEREAAVRETLAAIGEPADR